MRFRATILLGGKTATGFEVPPEVLEALGSGRRPAVHVTINGYAYRTTIGTMDGRSMIPLSAEHRTAAGTAAGEEVDVEVVLDDQPRTVDVPEDLAAALAAHPGARERFDQLAFTHRKEHVRAIEDAKKPETRASRIERCVAKVTAG